MSLQSAESSEGAAKAKSLLSRLSRRREGLKGLKGPKGITQQTSYTAVPLVSAGVFVDSGSEVGQCAMSLISSESSARMPFRSLIVASADGTLRTESDTRTGTRHLPRREQCHCYRLSRRSAKSLLSSESSGIYSTYSIYSIYVPIHLLD